MRDEFGSAVAVNDEDNVAVVGAPMATRNRKHSRYEDEDDKVRCGAAAPPLTDLLIVETASIADREFKRPTDDQPRTKSHEPRSHHEPGAVA